MYHLRNCRRIAHHVRRERPRPELSSSRRVSNRRDESTDTKWVIELRGEVVLGVDVASGGV